MGKIVFLFVCVALLQIASALNCYSCRGSDCEKEVKTWETKPCGASGVQPPAGYQYACLKLNYKDRVTQKQMVQRKCVTAESKNGKITFNCPNTDGDAIDCPVCTTDLCNTAPSIKISFVAVSSVVLAFLAPKLL